MAAAPTAARLHRRGLRRTRPRRRPVPRGLSLRPQLALLASKAASDHLVRAYHKTYGLQTITTHCSNNYGPISIEKLTSRAGRMLHGQPVGLYGDGLHVRDWLHVADHCRGLSLALAHGAPGSALRLGGQHEATNPPWCAH